MSDVTAAADGGHVPQQTFDLPGVLLVVGTEAFVAALVLLVGGPWSTWFLFLIPVTLAGMRLGPAGAIATWAVSAGLVALSLPRSALQDRWPDLTLCLLVFLVSGILTGMRSRQLLGRAAALEGASPLDPLTSVLRHEPFLARLADEVERADRYGHSLGLVMLAVDEFEEFTRVFGRYKADAMLEHLADVLRLAVRSTDLIGRAGDDGFAVALPYASVDDAPGIAERLRQAIGATSFEGDALEPAVTCQVSTGWASYPSGAVNALELLDAASAALVETPHESERKEAPQP